MTQAFIFDAIRTPRGKGKADGALHSVKPVNLVAGLLTALQQRTSLDTRQVDDVVWPKAGEQVGQDARHAVANLDPGVHLDCVALAVVEADGLDAVIPLQRPGQTGGAVLTAREQDKGGFRRVWLDFAHDKSAVGRSAARIRVRLIM